MKYQAQFFENVTEIRRDMTGVTGSGVLVLEYKTPTISFDEHGNGDEHDIEDRQQFNKNVKFLVELLNKNQIDDDNMQQFLLNSYIADALKHRLIKS